MVSLDQCLPAVANRGVTRKGVELGELNSPLAPTVIYRNIDVAGILRLPGDGAAYGGPRSAPRPRGERVHVSILSLNCTESERDRLASYLSPDEQERALRYLFDPDARRFIVRRAALRILLSSHVGTVPQSVRFRNGERGKPEIASSEDSGVRFSTSHSGEVALVAISRFRVGVDVERYRTIASVEDVARYCLSLNERCAVLGAPDERRSRVFLEAWTRKEALLKGLGWGLGDGWDPEIVASPSYGLSGPQWLASLAADAKVWLLNEIPAPVGYVASIAVEADAGAGVTQDTDPAAL